MNFLGIWISTSILSFVMDLLSHFRIVKVAADYGYKVHYDKDFDDKPFNSDENSETLSNVMKFNLLTYITPILNVLIVLYKSTIISKLLDEAVVSNINNGNKLIEMTEAEKREYAKNPTLSNAINISVNSITEERKKYMTLNTDKISNDSLDETSNPEIDVLDSKITDDISSEKLKEIQKEKEDIIRIKELLLDASNQEKGIQRELKNNKKNPRN